MLIIAGIMLYRRFFCFSTDKHSDSQKTIEKLRHKRANWQINAVKRGLSFIQSDSRRVLCLDFFGSFCIKAKRTFVL